MTQPDVFSGAFWHQAINNMANGGASTALTLLTISGLGQIDTDTHISLPGWSVAIAFAVGALYGLFYSLTGKALPWSSGAAIIGEAAPAPAKRAARRPAAKRPAKRTTKPASAPHEPR